jgi:Leucine-rich repeat (LRR) protein
MPKISLPGNRVLTGHVPAPPTHPNPTFVQKVISHLPLKVKAKTPGQNTLRPRSPEAIRPQAPEEVRAQTPEALRPGTPTTSLSLEKLPLELWGSVADQMDRETFENYRLASKATAHHGALSVKQIRVDRREDLVPALKAFSPGGVKNLTASFAGLTPDDAMQIAAHRSITSLDLSSNMLGDAGLKHLASLPLLTSFNARRNFLTPFTDEGMKEVAKMGSLKVLDLGANRLRAVDVEPLGADSVLTALKELRLDYNNLGARGAQIVAKLPSLESIDLEANRILDVGAEAVGAHRSIKSATLTMNGITAKGTKALAASVSLVELHAYGNKAGDEGAAALAKNPRLKTLHLGRNEIGNVGATALAGSQSLISLNLDSNQVGDEAAVALAANESLNSLSLAYNDIRNEGAVALAGNRSLISLNLAGNHIGDEAAIALAANESLTMLDVRNNDLTDVGRAALEAVRGRFKLLLL